MGFECDGEDYLSYVKPKEKFEYEEKISRQDVVSNIKNFVT